MGKSLDFCKSCHLTSSKRFSRYVCFVVPVAIFAALFCILCSYRFSYHVQLPQMTSVYSKRGIMKAVYIISRDFLSRLN